MSDSAKGLLAEFASKPLDEQLEIALTEDGPEHAATMSNVLIHHMDRIVTSIVSAQIVGMLWAAGRLVHKCGGSRAKLLEIAGRAYDYSVEFDLLHPEKPDRSLS